MRIKHLQGSDAVKPLGKEELRSTVMRYGSPDKHARVEGYLGSSGMKDSLSYQDNDITYGLVNTKPQNRGCFSPSDLKKETWKPKTTL